ncbi:uncharacterized protein LOC133900979 [Phragmites australis]|uniref:uncharacterized protein LOC133900979 n=1 Tax=Phragmites australis TaxID=29695 RepID=UPI002D786552|nr:uncharacterized protein LOC133900979 [Phragmites australis]
MDSKMVDIFPLPLLPTVVISFISSKVASLIDYKYDELYFTGIIPVILGFMNVLSYVDLELPLPRFKFLDADFPGFTCANIRIYIETAVVVVISYVSLLIVNWSYIWLAVFPVIAVWFIVALHNKLNRQSKPQQHDDGEAGAGSGGNREGGEEMKKAEGQEAAALVPYWVLCVMGQFHIADNFAVSQFLLFFSFILGALTLMMKRLALTGATPGVAPASVLLRKASLVVLLVAVHAAAAELLGEDVVLFILPELAPVLLWFSIHLDHGDSSIITADKIQSHRNVITILRAAAVVFFAFLAVYMDEFVLSWCTKVLVSCGVSGLLVYYVVFMLCQWPGQDSTTTPFVEPVKLLMFWANVLLIAAAALLLFTYLAAVWLGAHESLVASPAKFFNDYVIRSSSS